MNIHAPVSPASERLGWRLTYAGKTTTGRRPGQAAAGWPGTPVLMETAIDELLRRPGDGGRQVLDIVWGGAPGGSPTDLERQLEEWIAAGLGDGERIVRASIRTIRIVWSARRTYLFAPVEAVEDALDALARFTALAWKTSELEQDLRAVWPLLDAQQPLLQAAAKYRRRDRKALAALTDRVARMNSELLKVDPVLDQLDVATTLLSKRVFAELAEQAELESRLDLVEEPVDHAVDHCELLNDRVIESRQAKSSRALEMTIVALLLVEVVMSGYYLLWGTGMLPQASAIINQVMTLIG